MEAENRFEQASRPAVSVGHAREGGGALEKMAALVALFPEAGFEVGSTEIVSADEIPSPYRGLLAHPHHMTVTLEAHHRSDVHLVVDGRIREEGAYSRRLRLTAGEGGPVVLAGIMRFRMTDCTERIRREILQERTPLGKILIANCALRRIQPVAYLRVTLAPALREVFGLDGGERFGWGRVATIACNLRPVVDLLEVVPPARGASTQR